MLNNLAVWYLNIPQEHIAGLALAFGAVLFGIGSMFYGIATIARDEYRRLRGSRADRNRRAMLRSYRKRYGVNSRAYKRLRADYYAR